MDKQALEQAIVVIGAGNFGALRIAMEIAKEFGVEALELLLASGVRKHFLWMLYKDYNGESYANLMQAVMQGNFPPDIERVSDDYTAHFAEKQAAFAQMLEKATNELLKGNRE